MTTTVNRVRRCKSVSRVENEQVIGVIASAIQAIVTRTADEGIRSIATGDRVVTGTAVQNVATIATINDVVEVTACDGIPQITAGD